jgi:hypothetical protein
VEGADGPRLKVPRRSSGSQRRTTNLKRGASSRAGKTATEPSISVWKKTSKSRRASWQPGKPGEWRLLNGKEGAVGDESAGAARRG